AREVASEGFTVLRESGKHDVASEHGTRARGARTRLSLATCVSRHALALGAVAEEDEDRVASTCAEPQECVAHEVPTLLDRKASDTDDDTSLVARRVASGEREQLASGALGARGGSKDIPLDPEGTMNDVRHSVRGELADLPGRGNERRIASGSD